MNPSLPGGATGLDDGPDDGRWSWSTRLAYSFVPYGELQQGTDTVENPSELAADVHLGTLQVLAAAPTGTALDVQLPFGAVGTRSIIMQRTTTGVGDLELRVRQSAGRWLRRPRLAAAIGAVLPTGEYVAKSGAVNLPAEASYLTLGRGAPWWIAELDAQLALRRVQPFGQLSARGPLARTADEYAWGAEVRTTVGARVVALPGRLSIVAATDLQWRGRASEPDPFTGERTQSASAGGWQWTASPAAVVELGRGVSVSAGLRLPLYLDVVGNQLVPQTGGFVQVAYAPRPSPRPPPRYQPPPGQLTVVDYWATWCAPCAEISRALAGAAARWPDVRIVTIDASRWPADDAPALPSGAAGLPAIEVFDEAGARLLLLLGADAQRVVERVDELRARRARPASGVP